MSRYVCCCFWFAQSKNQRDSAPSVSMSSPFHDLLKHPQSVDVDLEQQLSQWQKAIFDFENSELQLIMKLPNEAGEILSKLKENPSDFVKHNVEIVRTLAKLRQEVIRTESILSSKRKMQPKSDAAPRPSMAAEFENFIGRESNQMGYFTERLSQIWSTRLNDIDPTQGSLALLHKVESGNSAPDVFVRPKWPDFLSDVSYDVIKVNKYGHQMRRIIKLTQNHVVSIKNGVEVTKFYHFLDIRRVGLRKGNRIYVLQRSGKRNLYLSPIAPHILQQLTTRIQVRRSLDRAILGRGQETSPGEGIGGYDVESAAEVIRAIAEANAADADSVMNHFATTLRERTVRTLSMDAGAVGSEGLSGKEREESEEEEVELEKEVEVEGEGEEGTREERGGEQETKEQSSLSPPPPPLSSSPSSSSHLSQSPLSSLLNEEHVAEADVLRRTVVHVLDNLLRQIEATSCEDSDHLSDLRTASPTQSRRKQRTFSSMSDSERSNSASGSAPRTPLLITFPENMPEHAIQEAVRKVIFDNSTPEGNTRKVFVENFRNDVANATKTSKELMLEVRHFIDGMHEHIVLARAYSLAILFQQQQQKRMASQLSSGTSHANGMGNNRKSSGGGSFGMATSSPMWEVWQKPSVEQLKFQRRGSLRVLRENNLGPTDVDEALLTTISYIVFVVVEEATFLSMKEQIIATVKQNKGYDEESTVVQKLKYFSRRSQIQWGISPEHISPLNWSTASFELSSIEHNLTPTYQLQVLTRTVKAIYNEFKHVVLPRLQEKGRGNNVFLGADDLVPIFLYVFCKSNLRHPIRNRDLMWALCHPDQLHGEGGYYLTVYESAIDFVLRESIEAENFMTPEEERAVGAGSITERGSDYVSFSHFFSGLLKMSGVVEEEGSMSMRESFN